MSKIRLEEQATPSTPAADKIYLYGKAGGGIYFMSDDGVEHSYAAGGANADITSIAGLTTALTVPQGGSGVKTLADGGLVIGNGTGAVECDAAGTLTQMIVGGGANIKPVWTEATGSDAPVRATSPTLVTPTIISTTSVADDAEITLDTAKTGWGTAMAGVNEEIIKFRFTAAGVVAVIYNSANAINTDTDGCLCVYDAGTGIAIKNRLGATKNIRYFINYS